MILLTAEVNEYKANPNRKARGVVIEAQLDKGRGPVATVLVQKGTLHVGDNIAIGAAYGKIRAMMDDKGQRVKEATPSTPVFLVCMPYRMQERSLWQPRMIKKQEILLRLILIRAVKNC